VTGNVLVIGGTGLLGAPVARQLLGDGCRVRVLARTLPAAPDRDRHLEYVQGDLDDSDARVASEARLASITSRAMLAVDSTPQRIGCMRAPSRPVTAAGSSLTSRTQRWCARLAGGLA
jgi:NAD(P)-dependent dehydrogenase (short-subunit alcohol dehydrogenase family)